jgi:hypothetical protein
LDTSTNHEVPHYAVSPSYLHCRASVHHQQQHTEKVERERSCRHNVSQKTQLFGVGKTYVFILSLTQQYKSPISCHAIF